MRRHETENPRASGHDNLIVQNAQSGLQQGRRRVKTGSVLSHPPSPEPAKTGSFPGVDYVEDFEELRTQLGKERVSARLGGRVE
jgi:hypothetical protein